MTAGGGKREELWEQREGSCGRKGQEGHLKKRKKGKGRKTAMGA